MQSSYLMVFDVGTGAGRVVIFDQSGQLIGKSDQEWSYQDKDDYLEFSIEQFWQILKNKAKEVIQQTGIDPEGIKAITVTSQREGIVLYNRKKQSLYAGPNVDSRGKKYNRYLADQFGDEIYQKTGHWPESLFAPGRIRWFQENRPEIFAQIDKMLLLNDWVLYELTGKMYSEPTNASETLFYNLKTAGWDQALLTKMAIAPEILAPLKQNGQCGGYLKDELAEEWGLSRKTPVIIGLADTQAALIGNGLYQAGEVGIVAGSTCPVQMIVDRLLIDREIRTWTSAFVPAGKYVIEANARATGLLLKWVSDSFYSHLSTEESFQLMEREAESIPPGSNGVLSFMGPVLSNVRDEMNNLRYTTGWPENLFKANGRQLLIRSILENIAFAIKGNIELLQDITKIRPSKLVITGGSTKNRLLLKILASLVEIPLYVSCQDETTSLGAAICAAVGLGYYANWEMAIDRMKVRVELVPPDKKWQRDYALVYRKWKESYVKLRGGSDESRTITERNN